MAASNKVTDTLIEIRGLHKRFQGSGGMVNALQDINLDIKRGEFVSLIGPSGCGKSTLLRLIADLIQPTEGQVSINGHSPQQARLNREYGFVFQSATLYDWRTVLKNVQLPLEVMKHPKFVRDQKARELLELVELQDFENHYPWQLSGGMQQRVSIARALVFQPNLLLMDEPFGALDEMTRERLNNELLSIWGQISEMTIIFVTHSISEAVYLSDRVVIMSPRPGRVHEVVNINLPRPRSPETLESDEYFQESGRVRHLLREVML